MWHDDLPGYLSEALERLRGELHRQARPRALAGVCPAARPLAVASLLDPDQTTVVVVPTPREAEELVTGLALLLPSLGASHLAAEAMETYHGHPPPLGATSASLRSLAGLAQGVVRVLVVPARVLSYPVPAPESIDERSLRLTHGGRLDPQECARQLVAAAYRRVDVVEEAGEFAVRGQVVDIGAPDGFFRAVLDFDTIEGLSRFDPATQRSTTAEVGIRIPPLRLFDASATQRDHLARVLEQHNCMGAATAAREGHTPGWWEGLLGWTQPHVAPWQLAQHLVVCEQEAVLTEVERTMVALDRARAALAGEQVLLPPPEAWLRPPDESAAALAKADRVDELGIADGTPWLRIATAPTPALASRPQALVEELRRGLDTSQRQAVVAATPGEAQRLVRLLSEADVPARQGWPGQGTIGVLEGGLARGFAWRDAAFVIYGRADVTHLPAPARARRALSTVLAEMRDLKVGDLVVHSDHGIGRFVGFRTLKVDASAHDCVELEYGGGGKLLVPLERADALERYAGSEGGLPRLDRLGGSTWAATKARVKRGLKDLADELLKAQAQREVAAGFEFGRDGPWQKEFEASFEYELTPDQAQAIREAKRDMESPRPMDRLLVGDVGYGKTEVAMRAAFKAVMDGKQVAVLAPTTILAEQHFRTFTRRFAGFPIEVRWLSRFLPGPEKRKVLTGVADGTVDLVIGTHLLLSRVVSFRDLGLVIIDEEQRFGVAQKERLRTMKLAVDVLALSATPIPRTLNLGLMGLRDISVIETPPRDRLAVQTQVLPFGREALGEAIRTEMARGGQVFFVHNRVASIGAMARLISETVPEARVVVAHGQMDERELERSVDSFFDGRSDVLLATAIVENGLDIPNANTLIVNRADRFGLAQLYQLRGRVGRSDRLAFAYLFVPPERALSEEARQRIAAILEFAELGAGFRIAARDLEIRGAGSLLGAEQHGHLRAVGYQTYCRLLEEAVHEIRGEQAPPPPTSVELSLGLDLRLPDTFIPEETLRLVVYRSIAGIRAESELEEARAEMVDRYGPAPRQLENLILHQRLRLRAEALGIVRVRRGGMAFELALDPQHPAAHGLATHLAGAVEGTVLTPAGIVRLPVAERGAEPAVTRLLEILQEP